jgi:hypothetical protein
MIEKINAAGHGLAPTVDKTASSFKVGKARVHLA